MLIYAHLAVPKSFYICIMATINNILKVHNGTQWGKVESFYILFHYYYNKSNISVCM